MKKEGGLYMYDHTIKWHTNGVLVTVNNKCRNPNHITMAPKGREQRMAFTSESPKGPFSPM